MKKALVIFLAFAMAGVVFADEPVAEAKVAEFTGNAAVTFGVDLDTGRAGFKNEEDVTLKLNLFNGGSKSTTGDGIWGELVIKTDGDNFLKMTKTDIDKIPMKVKVEKAQINFGPVYMGIKSGDLSFGGDFWFPNALNWKDDKDPYSRNQSAEFKYDQGFMLGYKHEMFKVEASFRSKKDTPKVDDESKIIVGEKKLKKDETPDGKTMYKTKKGAALADDNDLLPATPLPNDTTAYIRVYDKKDGDTNYWTNKFAVGVYGEVTPIKDLRVGVGGSYVIGEVTNEDGKNEKTANDEHKGDFAVFAGADYRLNIGDSFFLQPVVAYKLYNDYVWATKDKGEYKENGPNAANKLGFGLRFGFAKFKGKDFKSKDGNSLLKDFFGKDMVYNKEKEDDKQLLPGVSVYSEFDLKKDAMKTSLPLLVTFYPGELVTGLNAAAFVHVNLGPDAGKGAVYPMSKAVAEGILGPKGVQVGAAASYDVKVKDITIVPAAGVLFTYGSQKKDSDMMSASEIAAEAKVDVKGLVKNTTLTVAWDTAKFTNATSTFGSDSSYSNVKKGLVTLKAKIAF